MSTELHVEPRTLIFTILDSVRNVEQLVASAYFCILHRFVIIAKFLFSKWKIITLVNVIVICVFSLNHASHAMSKENVLFGVFRSRKLKKIESLAEITEWWFHNTIIL